MSSGADLQQPWPRRKRGWSKSTPAGDVTDGEVEEHLECAEVVKRYERELDERSRAERESRLRMALSLGTERPSAGRSDLEQGTAILAEAPRSYQGLFGAPAQSPWRPGEFFRCIANGWHDNRLVPMSQMGESSGAGGGLLVPQELERRLLDRAIHQSIVMSRANISPMTSKQKLVAGFAASDQSTTLYGFTFQWLAESQQVTPGSGQIRGILLNAHLGASIAGPRTNSFPMR